MWLFIMADNPNKKEESSSTNKIAMK